MTASALTHASRRGLLARRSPVLKLEHDERLVALVRAGQDRAFEVLVDRYQKRLLTFCTSMLKSRQDAEDVLQEVFVNAHKALLADDRKINLRPWLYRIARNRCLNHLRKPVPEGQDSMDIHPHQMGTTTAERVHQREELRQLIGDVEHLPETQRAALLLREVEQLSYDEIAVAMDNTIPSVKSLLVRARIALAECSEARALTCDEVRVQLAEAAEGLSKATGPIRQHVRGCADCKHFRDQLRTDRKALGALVPVGPLALIKGGALAKLFGGGGAAGGGAAATTGGIATGGGVAGAIGGTAAAGSAATGVGALGTALGVKAAAGVAAAALLTGAAVEVTHLGSQPSASPPAIERPARADGGPTNPAPRQKRPDQVPFAVAAAPVGAAGLSGEAGSPKTSKAGATAPKKTDVPVAVADGSAAANTGTAGGESPVEKPVGEKAATDEPAGISDETIGAAIDGRREGPTGPGGGPSERPTAEPTPPSTQPQPKDQPGTSTPGTAQRPAPSQPQPSGAPGEEPAEPQPAPSGESTSPAP